jgi:hypothetical protein
MVQGDLLRQLNHAGLPAFEDARPDGGVRLHDLPL